MPEVVQNMGSGPSHPQDASLESLKNRISLSDMGTRLVRDAFQLPAQKLSSRATAQDAAFDELLSFVFKYFSDLPDETVAAGAESAVAIMHDATLNDQTKKHEVSTLLDSHLSNSAFNELHSITSRVQARSIPAADDSGIIEDLFDNLSDDESHASDSQEASEGTDAFVAINDPILLHDHTLLRPQDVDAHWLEKQLKQADTSISVEDVTETLAGAISAEDCEKVLLSKLGVENAALVQLVSQNADVVLWYTRLHRAETGSERDAVLEEIYQRGLSIEDFAEKERDDMMDVDRPQCVDLSVVGRPMAVEAVPNLKLPEGSTRFTTETYEQYNVPALVVAKPEWPLKPVHELPDWAASAFEGIETLNLVQSRVCDVSVNTDDNILLCAPTGAGKTNVALLTLARCLHQGFSAVYISPLKALVQEQVRTLQQRLSDFVVAELSGDQGLSRAQLISTNVIVATPEKWDIVSRKPANTELLRSIGLVIIDEIHLLHDERRGSVIESIVSRHMQGLSTPRLVGLSATLPNYADIGEFLRVPSRGMFYFDSRFRPIPLEQKYVGVTAKSPLKAAKAINEACVEKVAESVKEGKQVLVFVHSRKDTQATMKLLLDAEVLSEDQVAVHHAGIDREQRAATESGFLDRRLRVLVCTATLAWGINLPAAVVVIKGTQYYDPSKEGWQQLQPQDVVQMLGRAGRPGFDASGLGVILTEHKHLSYFASVATMKLPIQSHLVNRILDSLNAEVSLGTVRSLDEAVEWLKRTFWSVRSTKDPQMYGVVESTPRDVAHSALNALDKLQTVVYSYPTVRATFQGHVASTFYVSPNSVNLYCSQLKPWLTEIDLLRVFCLSTEFSSLPVRRGEESEIKRLSSLVPLPVRDESTSRLAKVNVLVQAYICKLRLEGFALSVDMVYVAQSASRLFRAIFLLAVGQKWSNLARISLRLYIAVDKRQWYAGQSAFRQFSGCPPELIKRAEASQLPWKRYFDLDKSTIGEALRLTDPQIAATAAKYLSWFPRFHLASKALPLTRTVLQIVVEIRSLFEFNSDLHELSEQFYLMVEDQQGGLLEWRTLRLSELQQSASRRLTVFMPSDEYPPYLFVHLLSDKWLYSEVSTAVSLRSVLPPAKFASPLTLENSEQELTDDITLFGGREKLGLLQQSLIPLLYHSNHSTFVGLPPGTNNLACKEMVLERARNNGDRVLYITPKNSSEAVRSLIECFTARFSVSTDPAESADVCILTSVEVERLTRVPSRLQRFFGGIGVILCDDLHRLGPDDWKNDASGWLYEAAVSRLILGVPSVRVVGFGLTVATARAIGQWIGASKGAIANIALSSGLDGPTIEVRHWDGSLILGLRDLQYDFDSEESVALVVADSKQQVELAEKLGQLGFPDIPLSTQAGNVPSGSTTPLSVFTIDALLNRTNVRANKIVLFGTQRFEHGTSHDIPVADVLELVGRSAGEVIIYTDRLQYYAAFVKEPFPLESDLAAHLLDGLVPEIASGKVSEPQDAVDWLVSTYLYRRLRHNPSYYGSRELEDWISDAVEDTFEKLGRIGAIELREEDLSVSPLAPAHIATHHGVSIEALVNTNYRIQMKAWKTHTTQNVEAVRLIDARVDLAVSCGDLARFFSMVDARQLLIQSVPVGASPLLQIPYIDDRAALKCQDMGILSVQEFVAIDDDEMRSTILGFDNEDPRMLEVANFVNHYPIVDIISVHVADEMASIVIERDMEEDDEVLVVGRDLPPELSEKEMWYVVVGDTQLNAMFGMKKTAVDRAELRVDVPLSGVSDNMTAWLVCDSYIDADKEFMVTK